MELEMPVGSARHYCNVLSLVVAVAFAGLATFSADARAAEVQADVIFLNGRIETLNGCLLYTSPSPRDRTRSRMPSSA